MRVEIARKNQYICHKWKKSGCKGLIFVSLGSTTVQLHANLSIRHACASSEAVFSNQNGDRLRSALPKSSVLLCIFSWSKGLSAKEISKEMFPLCIGKYLSHKAVNNWVEKFSQVR
jgi:hypothetical protein